MTEPSPSLIADTTSTDATPSPPTETPFQPKPEPTPPQSSTLPSAYDGFDLKNMYPGKPDGGGRGGGLHRRLSAGRSTGAIRLANREREGHGLDPLLIVDALIELAEIRAEEIRGLYSYTRPDGTP